MRKLTLEGVAPAEAARCALEPAEGGTAPAELEFPGGGAAKVTGLSRAALALDAPAVRHMLREAAAADGVIATWDGLLAPVLRAVGDRWEATGEGVEVEHLLSEAACCVLSAVQADPPAPARPVLLACADGERHSLPLHALCAALAERGVAARMLGAALPPAALAAAVRRTGPAALVVHAEMPEHAVAGLLAAVPALRPPTAVLAGGAGWVPESLPERVTYVHDLGEAVHLTLVATGHA
jgi:methanogenic corrinoid protein MtbC1